MTLSNAEQYVLELMNRARLDPAGEAARYGISLNDGLAAGTITSAAKQVLAPNDLLETAATLHSTWMLDNDIFSHTGAGGSDPGVRISAQGYHFWAWGENLAIVGSTGPITIEGSIDAANENLFRSAVHRSDLMTEVFREVGIGAESGVFTQAGVNYNATMVTEDFGSSGTAKILTGVVYQDRSNDDFYSMGEGKAGSTFTVGLASTQTAAAGGYAIAAGTSATTTVTGTSGAVSFKAVVDMSHGNVKLDLVGDLEFKTSGNITLVSGVRNVDLLGVGNLRAIGNAAGNHLTGNLGDNNLQGRGGKDILQGLAGNDTLKGGLAADQLIGGAGNDVLSGEAGNDTFVFKAGFGTDRITDFRLSQGDHLSLSHDLWTGTKTAGEVVNTFAHIGTNEVFFDFGAGNEIHLTGMTTLTGLASTILIL